MSYNQRLPIDKFPMLDAGERLLKQLGFEICRIRLYGEVTRIEIMPEKFLLFINKRDEIIKELKNIGFKYINLDIENFRSESMDKVL